MDITLSADHRAIDESVARIAARFGDDYWTECDQAPRFPHEFHKAMAEAGWLGITMPVELGGAGLGVTEATIMMQAVARRRGLCGGVLDPSQHLRPPCHRRARPHGRTEALQACRR